MYKDDTHQCETMHDDNTAVKRSSLCSKEMEASRVTAARKPWHCLAHPQRAHYSQSFRDKVVLPRVLKQFNGRTGVSCNEMVHERWLAALETAKFNTNFQSVLWPDATKCSLTLHARVGGAVSRLASPTHYTTLHCALPSHALFLSHTHSFHITHHFHVVIIALSSVAVPTSTLC
jgi:hypothetical protein